jgi:uncharacterized protein
METEVAPEFVQGPVTQSERIQSLDVLRGFAVLGILVMNIQSFAMIDAAYFNPATYGNLEGANYWVWYLSHLLFDQKFMTIFSLLFGAGIVLMTSRAEARGKRARALHYRRMGVLMLIGLVHAYLLWHGDVLVPYAMCGMILYPLRRIRPSRLILIGSIFIALASAISLMSGWSMQSWDAESIQRLRNDWAPTPELIASELAAFRGDWVGQIVHRAPKSFKWETFIFLWYVFWRAGGLMLVGMGFLKLGIFSGERARRFYATLIAAAVLVGLPLVIFGVHRHVKMDWKIEYSFFFGTQFNYWGSLFVSGGWIGLMMLLCKASAVPWLTRRLAAVGRMAFTNYLMQSIICTLMFYGHGLGLFGKLERVEQALTVAAIWIIQLWLSPIWLRYFQFGPFEWLWRSLSYRRLQPMRQP